MTGSDVFQLRQRLELTQGLLATLIGVHCRTISRYEQHPEKPIPQTVAKLLEIIAATPPKVKHE